MISLPDFPWDRLTPYGDLARAHPDGIIDLSIGTAVDPTPAVVQRALAEAADAPGYPTTIGTERLRHAIAGWLRRRVGVTVDPVTEVLPSIGSKELVALLPTLPLRAYASTNTRTLDTQGSGNRRIPLTSSPPRHPSTRAIEPADPRGPLRHLQLLRPISASLMSRSSRTARWQAPGTLSIWRPPAGRGEREFDRCLRPSGRSAAGVRSCAPDGASWMTPQHRDWTGAGPECPKSRWL